jgi:hypothetical protein
LTPNLGGTMERRAQLAQHLREIETLIAEDDTNMSQQRRIIARLTKEGHDVTDARKLLGDLEAMRQQHVLDRKRILAELGD